MARRVKAGCYLEGLGGGLLGLEVVMSVHERDAHGSGILTFIDVESREENCLDHGG